ncbi:MAG: MFS transporter [Gemmatimonadales bacterium]|nr:MFS transporter [Gemmatimonadales bacterium]
MAVKGTSRPDSMALTPEALERITTRSFLLGMICQGFWWAGFILVPFVMAKSLGGSGWQVTSSVTMELAGMLLALYWGQLMVKGGRRRGLFWGGLGGRAILVLTVFVHTPNQFLILLVLVYFFASLFYPAQNGILQANIHPSRHGRVFGWGALVQHLTTAAVSVAMGRILDYDADLFRYVYPVLGIVGFMYPLIMARLPRPVGDQTHDPENFFTVPRIPLGPVKWGRLAGAVITPFREARAVFSADRSFAWFEVNFMFYGLAFMMLMPVVPLFFIEELNLSYQEISSSRVLIASLGVALLGPLMGRLMDSIHPVRVCTLSFGIIALYPAALALGAIFTPGNPAIVAYSAFVLYSVGMAGVNVTWNIGSIAFAPQGQGGFYQGIHVAMVGVRGLLGPAIGFIVLKLFGYREVFVLASVTFLVAAGSSWVLGRRCNGR